MNKILLASVLVFVSSLGNAQVDQVNLEDCKDNADLLGYVTTIQGICQLHVDQKRVVFQKVC